MTPRKRQPRVPKKPPRLLRGIPRKHFHIIVLQPRGSTPRVTPTSSRPTPTTNHRTTQATTLNSTQPSTYGTSNQRPTTYAPVLPSDERPRREEPLMVDDYSLHNTMPSIPDAVTDSSSDEFYNQGSQALNVTGWHTGYMGPVAPPYPEWAQTGLLGFCHRQPSQDIDELSFLCQGNDAPSTNAQYIFNIDEPDHHGVYGNNSHLGVMIQIDQATQPSRIHISSDSNPQDDRQWGANGRDSPFAYTGNAVSHTPNASMDQPIDGNRWPGVTLQNNPAIPFFHISSDSNPQDGLGGQWTTIPYQLEGRGAPSTSSAVTFLTDGLDHQPYSEVHGSRRHAGAMQMQMRSDPTPPCLISSDTYPQDSQWPDDETNMSQYPSHGNFTM